MNRQIMVYVEWDPESKMFIGKAPAIPGAHSFAPTLDELRVNMKEAIELVLEDCGEELDDLPEFVGFQSISIAG